MKLSIRTRVTALITFVYALVFALLLTAGSITLYHGLKEDIDNDLETETQWMITLFQGEFRRLLSATGRARTTLEEDFLEELNEIHGYKNQFVIFFLETESGQRIYSDGGIKNAVELLPDQFLSRENGYYDLQFGGVFFRILLQKLDWGSLVVGVEDQIFIEIAHKFKRMLAFGVPLSLVMVLLFGHFLARRSMRPIVSAAESAEAISLSNLKQRLPAYAGTDEFGILVATLNGMIARLENGVSQVQQFTQDAAHELRTPLTILRGHLELAYQERDVRDDTRAALQNCLDRTIAMAKIVENLLLLSRSDTGNYPIQISTFQIDEIVRDIADDMATLVNNCPIEIKLIRCDKVQFAGDRQLLQRLILNLSDNALKHTQKGSIEFTLLAVTKHVEFTVRDTGEGIPQDDLPHIYDRFYRADKARARSSGGSGLGLSICKWIAQAHNGRIEIESELAVGTLVRVILPYERPPNIS